MTRTALPQDYFSEPGVLLDDFETLANWTNVIPANCTIAENTSEFKTGTKGLKMTVGAGLAGWIRKQPINVSFNGRNACISFWLYLHQDPAETTEIVVYLANDTAYTNAFAYAIVPAKLDIGWNRIVIDCNDNWTKYASASWQNPIVSTRFKVQAASGKTPSVSFDNYRYNLKQIPQLLVMFDDASASVYDKAFEYMNDRNIKGTVYTISSWVGNSDTMTVQQLLELQAAGWTIGNHSATHSGFATKTQSEVEAELNACEEFLTTNGLAGGKHFACPTGAYTEDIRKAAIATGLITMRTSYEHNFHPTYDSRLRLSIHSVTNATALATVVGWVNDAILNGKTLMLLWHQIVDTDPTQYQMLTSTFQQIIDYLYYSKIKTLTIDEWYKGLTNPRYRSLPLSRQVV
jgi:peptidoglycan/xylan/chitin deacetylase (PgdA/CDA1 family)